MLITSWKCGAPCRTAGRPLAKLPEDHWQNCRQNRRKTAGRPLAKLSAKPPENRRKTTGKTVGKTAGKPPGKAPFLGDFCQSQ